MKVLRPLTMFGMGGLTYILIEILWRGYTHWTMFLVGGICFVLIGGLNERFTFEMSLLSQMTISAVAITVIEFVVGCIVNIWLHMNVWDYSEVPLNLFGQICVPYMVLWFLLSFVGIVLDDFIRYKLYREEWPRYKVW